VLDDKRPEVAALVAEAPLMIDHLCDDCRAHYDAVRGHLTDIGVGWTEAPKLVRGLDYYRRTTFEWQHKGLGAQSAVGGGGRYDGLSESIGGPALPGIGWALGMERILLALEAEGVAPPVAGRVDVYIVAIGPEAKKLGVRLVDALRAERVSADIAYGDRKLGGAMKAAARSGAATTVVIGERELAESVAQVKDMESGEQRPVALESLIEELVR
jgi:histidyl-tRNA synthetase